jgi:hypothetical protein
VRRLQAAAGKPVGSESKGVGGRAPWPTCWRQGTLAYLLEAGHLGLPVGGRAPWPTSPQAAAGGTLAYLPTGCCGVAPRGTLAARCCGEACREQLVTLVVSGGKRSTALSTGKRCSALKHALRRMETTSV